MVERYLSVPEVAERLGTKERFARRLIEERRIEFKRFGRHVRVAESVLLAYIDSCTVSTVRRAPTRQPRRLRRVA
ncbi:helix-turn-helix domain-containing protein [Phytohabitans sp. ZYX-F-186]|uniref:Helix-turn-helix domain-containing protein n=1 Tax=Phytohabitans maris TaxID=3071409 RepID=A0ABU0ZCP2_9ACTN|nr:helix-turn-helix domain-containing protein [Phytohabitans sp. ZYX-F-186]MDQ7904833.1 helix-turn-helix domain-containing protein [Phytohabitans sp. ZYX-F-186]